MRERARPDVEMPLGHSVGGRREMGSGGLVWLWGRAIKTDELLLHYGKSLGQNDVEMNCCSAVFCAHYALFFPG